MDTKEYNIEVYKNIRTFGEEIAKNNRIDLAPYLEPEVIIEDLRDVFYRFIFSSQNYQSMPKVIDLRRREDAVKEILHGYDIKYVSNLETDCLYKTFRNEFEIKSKDSPMNSWRRWSSAIIDSAKFLSQFKNADDFKNFVGNFDYNAYTSMALPLLISHKIKGIGFALACDILKELGFTRYPKPDVHLIEVFYELGLSTKDAGDTYEAIIRMSDYCKEYDPSVTPYKIDKAVWLICSGRYYKEKPQKELGSQKKELIKFVKDSLV